MAKWKRSPLATVAHLCLGKMLDQAKNRGEPLPYLANVNVRWGEFVLDNLRTMRFEQHEMDRYGLKYGDIVMCEGGEPGRCAIWKEQMPGMMIQKALHRIRPAKLLDFRFLYYDLRHIGFSKGFDRYFTGATIKHLTGEKLAKVEVDVPPLATQKKIAATLSSYDDLIQNNERRIKILEDMAQNLYREWFVNFRFPDHAKVKMVDSPMGKIPQGWDVSKLAAVANVNQRTIKKGETPEEILYIDIASVATGVITQKQRMPFATAPGRARRIVEHGDIIWSCVRPNRRSFSLILNPEPHLIASTGFAVISGTKIPFSYLYFSLTTEDFVGYLVNHATGSAYPAVNSKDFEDADILKPTDTLLTQFHETVAPMLELSHQLTVRNASLRQTRDLLLPKLISGEVDVSELEIQVPEKTT